MKKGNYPTIQQLDRLDKLGFYEYSKENMLITCNILDAADFLREKFEIDIGFSIGTINGLYYGYIECYNDALNQKFIAIYDKDIYKMRQDCITEGLNWAEKIQKSQIKTNL